MSKIIICGIRYEFIRRDLGKHGDMYNIGDCQYRKPEINLTNNREIGAERLYTGLIHESLHAMLNEACCLDMLKPNIEEAFVSTMEAPLAAFIRDNISIIRRFGKF